MAGQLRGGPLWIKLSRSEQGQRTYSVAFQVEVDATPGSADGPQNVIQTPGLPVPGSLYFIGSDVDPYAYCTREVEVNPDPSQTMTPGGPAKFYIAEYKFKSPGAADQQEAPNCTGDVENPLFQPMVIRRSFADWSEEATEDRSGQPIQNSSWEPIRGPQVEFESTREVVIIEQNVLDPQDDLLDSLKDTVNRDPLWGRPRRSIRFVLRDVQTLWYGQCYKYRKRIFEFRIRTRKHPVSGLVVGDWDKVLPDEGFRALNGHWGEPDAENRRWILDNIPGYGPPNPNIASHFVTLPGPDNLQLAHPFPLDGGGRPYEAEAMSAVTACNKCARGAPTNWTVTGIGEDFTITHVALCQWSGGSGASLTFDAGNNGWLFAAAEGEYRVPLTSWNCRGPNVMRRDGAGTGPDSVTLTPVYSGRQGIINVEKYGDGDYLQLGIPLVL